MDYDHVKANFAVRSRERFHMCKSDGFLERFAGLDQMGIESQNVFGWKEP